MTCCSTNDANKDAKPCCKGKSCKTTTMAAIALLIAAIGAGAYCYTGRADAETAKAPVAAAKADAKDKGPVLSKAVKDDTVYAVVNGQNITGKDVNVVIKTLPPQIQSSPASQVLPMLVNQMANDRLVDELAAKDNLADDAKVKERMAAVQKQLVRERFVEKQLDGKTTDAALKKKYEELLTANPPQQEVHARHILVKDEQTAKDLIAKLEKGEDFAKLAKENSIDPSKDNGGDLGYFTKTMMVKEFGDAAFAMKKGEYTKTPVKTQFGYHIIKVEDVRMQEKPKFDTVKDQVKGQLNQDLIRQMIDDLRQKNKVEIKLPE